MSLNPSTFETLVLSRYITFTIPINNHLRVAVLDSPSAAAPYCTAAMCVPSGRESDWIFSTFTGHLQLLLSSPTTPPLSRLILVGNSPAYPHPTFYDSTLHPITTYPHPTSYDSTLHPSSSTPFQQTLAPLLLGLIPKSEFRDGEIPEVPFLNYEDEVLKSSILEICEGPCVGEMLIENVELVINGVNEFRRRLRFKRMPNFVQSQILIRPRNENSNDVEFELDRSVLVQPYLSPMVAGLSVINRFLEGRIQNGLKPKALCLGVGGGALLGFLSFELNFEVVGVEEDEVVLEIARRYFGLKNDDFVHLFAENAMKFVIKLAKNVDEEDKFHAIMVDLDSSDVTVGVCAPPVEFVRKSVLVAIRDVLCGDGVVIVNVIPSSKLFYERLISEFQNVFEELYEIDEGNGENLIIIATKSVTENALDGTTGTFSNKLKSVVCIDCIRKISWTADPTL